MVQLEVRSKIRGWEVKFLNNLDEFKEIKISQDNNTVSIKPLSE